VCPSIPSSGRAKEELKNGSGNIKLSTSKYILPGIVQLAAPVGFVPLKMVTATGNIISTGGGNEGNEKLCLRALRLHLQPGKG
jgi:hypothetical protein